MNGKKTVSSNDRSFIKYIKSFSMKGLIGLLLLALVITSSLSTLAEAAVNLFLPSKTVEIYVPDGYDIRSLPIIEVGGNGDISNIVRDSILNADSLQCTSFVAKAKPSFFFVVGTDPFVPFSVRSSSGFFELTESSNGLTKVYPYENSYVQLALQFLIYGLLYFLITICLFLVDSFFRTSGCNTKGVLFRKYHTKAFWLIWAGLYIIIAAKYTNGIDTFLSMGDERQYWTYEFLNNGKIDFDYLSESLLSFRGYLCYFLPTISKLIGNRFGFDSIYFYLLFSTLSFAWLSGYIVPNFYKILNNKDANNLQVILFLIIYAFFWREYLYSTLVDNYAAVCFISGAYYAYSSYCSKNKIHILFSSIFFSIAVDIRVAYSYCLYFAFILIIIIQVINKKLSISTLKNNALPLLKLIPFAVLPFLIISLPELLINLRRNCFSFLPYDYSTAWDGRSLMITSANLALTNGNIVCPGWAADTQMLRFRNLLYDGSEEFLSFAQLMDIYANEPLESFVIVFKKLFEMFDKKTTSLYKLLNIRDQKTMLFSLFNYFIQYCGLYYYFKKSKKNLKIIGAILFFGAVLPQMFVHVEWRYAIASFLMVIYLFSYHFVGEIVCDKYEYKELSSSFNIWLSLYIFISMCLTYSLWL